MTIVHADGTGDVYELQVTNGTPIVNGQEWMEKMEYITNVCPDTTQCGGYINRWMGSPNPAFLASRMSGNVRSLSWSGTPGALTKSLQPAQTLAGVVGNCMWKEQVPQAALSASNIELSTR